MPKTGPQQERDNVSRVRFMTAFRMLRKEMPHLDKEFLWRFWDVAFSEGHEFACIQIRDAMDAHGYGVKK